MLSTQAANSYTANIATAFSTPSASPIPEASNDANGEVHFAELHPHRPGMAAKLSASTRAIAMEGRAAMDDGDRLAALL